MVIRRYHAARSTSTECHYIDSQTGNILLPVVSRPHRIFLTAQLFDVLEAGPRQRAELFDRRNLERATWTATWMATWTAVLHHSRSILLQHRLKRQHVLPSDASTAVPRVRANARARTRSPARHLTAAERA